MSEEKKITAFVHIIESPSPGDLLDGRTEGRVLGEALRLAAIPHCYHLACDELTFAHALGERLSAAWKAFDRPPVLHLSMHGNEHGVQLTNGAFIRWDALRLQLQPIATAMNGGLLICMSSCFGAAGCRMAMHEGPEPTFWALVGHPGDAAWADAAVAYISFYHLLFKGRDLNSCVAGMRAASGDNGFLPLQGASTRAGWVQKMSEMRRDAFQRTLAQVANQRAAAAGPPAALDP